MRWAAAAAASVQLWWLVFVRVAYGVWLVRVCVAVVERARWRVRGAEKLMLSITNFDRKKLKPTERQQVRVCG